MFSMWRNSWNVAVSDSRNHQTKILTDGSGKNGKAFDMVSFTAAGGARDGEDDDLRMLEVSAGHGQLPTRDWLDRGGEKGNQS